MPPATLPRITLRWTPDDSRKRGRPKETWKKIVEREREREMKENNWTWVTWKDEHPTEPSGELWPRPYVFRDTRRIK